jgi:hypothetical protein
MLTLNSTVCGKPVKPRVLLSNNPEDVTIGNPQATREEIGWLAGIIDGEGYLGFQVENDRRQDRKSFGIRPELHISNTDEAIILRSQGICRKIGVNPYIRATKANTRVQKDQYRLQVRDMNKLAVLLNAVRDNLTGLKQQRADLVLEFIALRQQDQWTWIRPQNKTGQSGAIKPYSDREWQIVHECKAYQERGASETTRRAQRQTSEIWALMESRQLEVAKI